MAYTKIKIRGDIATNWSSNNPVLADREVGLATDVKKFKVGNGSDDWNTLDYFNETDIPQSLVDDVNNNKAELLRLKTLINENKDDVYSYRGGTAPALPLNKKAYYISMHNLQVNQIISLPANAQLGTIVSIDNTDKVQSLRITPAQGDMIDDSNVISLSINPEAMIFLIKVANGWNIAYQGVLLDDLQDLIDEIKSNIPSTGIALTIEQIQAALKDRLHTFSEIQKEFNDQLHTLADIQTDTATHFADQLHTLLDIKNYIELQLDNKLHTFDEIDAHIESEQGFTAEEIRDKLETLQLENRLDASAIKNIESESIVINLTGSLTIDVDNISKYNNNILSCIDVTNQTQTIRLPEINTIIDFVTLTISNHRGDGNVTDVMAFVGEDLGGEYFLRLNDMESVTIEKPVSGKAWIITSITRVNTIKNIVNGGNA